MKSFHLIPFISNLRFRAFHSFFEEPLTYRFTCFVRELSHLHISLRDFLETNMDKQRSSTLIPYYFSLRNLFNLLIQCPQLKLSVLEVTFQTIAKTVVEYANFSSKESRMVEKRISSAYRLSVLFT